MSKNVGDLVSEPRERVIASLQSPGAKPYWLGGGCGCGRSSTIPCTVRLPLNYREIFVEIGLSLPSNFFPMVKTKQQKSKTTGKASRKEQIKKNGKQTDMSEFRAQLDALGLKVIEVTADGNCFFRALSDQLEGNEEEYEKYRNMVVQFIMKNRDMFEPFIEDEVPFEEYCESMEKDGTWAGHMELQAASLVTHGNICIHRHMSPRWYIRNFDNREAKMIHLSYHDGEHYNSVRSKEDACIGPAMPITIKADADLSATSGRAKISVTKSKGEKDRNIIQPGSLKMAMAGSGCEDVEKVKQALEQVAGDVDAAVEYLVAAQGSDENLVADGETPSSETALMVMAGDGHKEKTEQKKIKTENKTCTQDLSRNNSEKTQNKSNLLNEEKIPRNKACPCGSKKKYKSCCGSVSGKSSARFTGNETADNGNARKDKRQGKKAATRSALNHNEYDGALPDLGALCI